MTEENSVRVYIPWLRASIIITPADIDEPSKGWIEAANNWQRRAEAAESKLIQIEREQAKKE